MERQTQQQQQVSQQHQQFTQQRISRTEQHVTRQVTQQQQGKITSLTIVLTLFC